jgi:MSHA biogenesis protein MshK
VCKFIISFFSIVLLSTNVWANESNPSEVRDPTAPLGYSAVGAATGGEQFALNSILISPQRKLAIINGNTLREGQIVPGSAEVKVQKILARAVVLQQADQTWVLRLSPSILKKH